MKILVVDNICQRLMELEITIKTIFPDEEVKSFIDPMMAAKYGVRHNVDIIIAERKMRPIDGFQMAGLVHKFNSIIKIYLIIEADETFDGVDDSNVADWLERPNIEKKLREIAAEQQA